jgi:hypothetical protein
MQQLISFIVVYLSALQTTAVNVCTEWMYNSVLTKDKQEIMARLSVLLGTGQTYGRGHFAFMPYLFEVEW